MSSGFRPAFLHTAPGGLPHTSAIEALSLLRSVAPTVLSCPRLPRRSANERAFVQAMQGFPGLVSRADDTRILVERADLEARLEHLGLAYLSRQNSIAALDADYSVALGELLRQAELRARPTIVTYHLPGPVSLGLHLTDDQQRPLMYDEELFEAMVQYLALRMSWLSARLSTAADQVVIMLHEPFLSALDSPFSPLGWQDALDLLDRVANDAGGDVWLNIGNYTPENWPDLLQTSLSGLAFNTVQLVHLTQIPAELRQFCERGGVLIWRLVPTEHEAAVQHATVEHMAAEIDQTLAQMDAAGLPTEQIVQASLISPTNELDHLSVPTAEQALRMGAALSALLRERYQLAPTLPL
ncbi:MAG: hypothetical protein HC893_16040 [Chloroflexaceae bacterium]|nr:hypothetical protein [Chloroflexaceae bacterium]NJO06001.1 hypothetical protein [Chloroflexaceae bacterium]